MNRDVIYTLDRLPDNVDRGRVYKRKHRSTSIVTKNKIIKDASGFETVERAAQAYKVWSKLGFSGAPSSPARIFSRMLEKYVEEGEIMPPQRANLGSSPIDSQSACWLWIEAMVPPASHVTGTVHHYDINQAFWSATRKGLPSEFFPYREGDDRWVGRVKIKSADRNLPAPWRYQDEAYLTADDVRFWGMDVEIIDAVTYEDHDVDLTGIMREIGRHFSDWTSKHARQQSWGVFAQSPGSIFQEIYKDGKLSSQSTLPERWTCPEWATIITRRIMRQVASRKREGDAVALYVDSILSRREISGQGSTPGTWRKEGHYSQGVYIEGPGLWDSRPRATRYPSTEWRKHAGISAATKKARTTAKIDPEEDRKEMLLQDWEEEYKEYLKDYTQDWLEKKEANSYSKSLKKEAPF